MNIRNINGEIERNKILVTLKTTITVASRIDIYSQTGYFCTSK